MCSSDLPCFLFSVDTVYDGFVFCLLLIWILGFEGNRVDCLFPGLGLSSKWVQIEVNLEMNLDLCLCLFYNLLFPCFLFLVDTVYDGFVFCLLLIWILGFQGNKVDCLFPGLGLSSKWVQI